MAKSTKNTCQHTRSIQLDRRRRPMTAPPDPLIEQRLTDLIHPATFAQVAHFHALGLRERTLNLPVMMAVVLSLIWRQLGSVTEVLRLLQQEGLLWCSQQQVTQQSLSHRLGSLPAELFRGVLLEVLPLIHQRWRQRSGRQQRSGRLSRVQAWAAEQFDQILIADASTLDAVVKRVGLLRHRERTPLAGKMVAVLDLLSRQPRALWYRSDAAGSEQRCWDEIIEQLPANSLLLIDKGFGNYQRFAELSRQGVWFLTPAKSDTAITELSVLSSSSSHRDRIVRLGQGKHVCSTPMRLIEVEYEGKWYRYLSNVLAVERLPARTAVRLYRERWRVEEVFLTVKRLLGLAYFYSGSQNAIELQLWASWILYAVLQDLVDELAEQLEVPTDQVSLEMVYRGLYYYTQAYHRQQTRDPIGYLSQHAAQLGIIKRRRKPRQNTATMPLTSEPEA